MNNEEWLFMSLMKWVVLPLFAFSFSLSSNPGLETVCNCSPQRTWLNGTKVAIGFACSLKVV